MAEELRHEELFRYAVPYLYAEPYLTGAAPSLDFRVCRPPKSGGHGRIAKVMGILSHWPLILILVIVLIILGPGKLPQIGGAIGGAIKEFRKTTNEIKDEVTQSVAPSATAPVMTAAPVDPTKESPAPTKV
jgi:sec-independent protein translocase protein TatA